MNIVLIGMPGSGKTTVGKILARQLGLPLLDTDALVEAAGRSIPEIFASDGEDAFRDLETAAAERAAAEQGVIIATGGGIIKRKANMDALSRTGIVFFLDRPPEEIAAGDHAGRPLIGADRSKVYQLYQERIDRYRAFADYIIKGADTPEGTAAHILSIYEAQRKEGAAL